MKLSSQTLTLPCKLTVVIFLIQINSNNLSEAHGDGPDPAQPPGAGVDTDMHTEYMTHGAGAGGAGHHDHMGHDMASMELPPEHINFAKCDEDPGDDPDLSGPPKDGFEMDIRFDFPEGNVDYVPECQPDSWKNATFGEAHNGTAAGVDPTLPSSWKIEKPISETTESLGIVDFHMAFNQSVKYQTPIPAGGPHKAMWAAYGVYSS